MNVGDAFVNVDPGSLTHLWIVIAKSSDSVVIVNFTTKPSFSHDDTCTVTKGEHPFVVHETIVNYRQSQVVDDAVLEGAKAHGYIEMRDAVSPGLLRRIQEGAIASPYAPQKVQSAVQAALAK